MAVIGCILDCHDPVRRLQIAHEILRLIAELDEYMELDNSFAFHNAEKLFKPETGRPRRNKTGSDTGSDLLKSSYLRQPWGQWEWPLTTSSPERAILEVLDEARSARPFIRRTF
jgi:hypothetical protein